MLRITFPWADGVGAGQRCDREPDEDDWERSGDVSSLLARGGQWAVPHLRGDDAMTPLSPLTRAGSIPWGRYHKEQH